MTQNINKEISLEDYANKYNIYELSSEDIIKLMTKPYLIVDIAEAFGITEDAFNELKKKKGIKNIILEDTIRNIETILHYIDRKNRYISKNVRKEITDFLINTLIIGAPKKQFYLNALSEIDFSREKVNEDMSNKKIDVDYRLERLSFIILDVEYMVHKLIGKEKSRFLDYNEKILYNQLCKEQESGNNLNKDDLTYDVLYELSIIENIPDSLIGNLYNMNRNQVRYLRTKFGFANILATRLKNHPEAFIYNAEKNNKIPPDISIYEFEKLALDLLNKIYDNNNNNNNNDDDSTACASNRINDIIINDGEENHIFHVNFSDEKYSTNAKSSNRKSNGSHRNQKKDNETKISHGKIGEQIALNAEKMRLTKIGLGDLVDDVKLISQIGEDITLDGLGYDMLSFNVHREPICIEVKTSYGTKDKPFFISKKEIELMQGIKEEYKCKECLIYYVLINGDIVTIKNITPYDLNNLKLTPVLYKVE